MKTEFRLSIDITITAHQGSLDVISPAINAAMQELINRKDFQNGTIRPGRVIVHHEEFHGRTITVDLNRLTAEQLRQGN